MSTNLEKLESTASQVLPDKTNIETVVDAVPQVFPDTTNMETLVAPASQVLQYKTTDKTFVAAVPQALPYKTNIETVVAAVPQALPYKTNIETVVAAVPQALPYKTNIETVVAAVPQALPYKTNIETVVAAVPQALPYKARRESEPLVVDEAAASNEKTSLEQLEMLKQTPGIHSRTDIRYDSCAHWTYSKGYGLPEYTERRVLNDVTVYYHVSRQKSKMPCPDWINTTAEKELWGTIHDWTDHNIEITTLGFQTATQQFNLTGSLSDRNIYQVTGCCSLYPNGTYTAFMNHAFNGKDFTSFDINTKTFVAAVPQAVRYKTLRESQPLTIDEVAEFYKKTCLERLKMFKQAPEIHRRKDPNVWILQQKKRAGSVTVTCHVTGFYPREVQVFWLGPDLQPVDEEVTEILPNGDGTYQTRKSVIVPEEDVGKQNYSCVVLHISVPNNITTVWVVKTRSWIFVWAALVFLLVVMVVIGGFVFRRGCKSVGSSPSSTIDVNMTDSEDSLFPNAEDAVS
ncbi:class I histocompatibility antigen, F10 alpha chain-like [Astyanax mexicanus]|uniref:Class I histocompatibility antigen, F10 alpha chain-like n=1 Tax=Astyanax mexicanus TaxID=7994 RepID=A0A8T2KZY1_ASTMX|nr:class I histocompatibility antigen, F10 alpha chain-like [Astyanax mexicanus]